MSKFFIRRPIVAIVIAILMTIVGAVTMIQLPIEQQMSGVDKSNYIQSVNANGSIRMTVNFETGTDPNVDHILTQMRVNQASSQLPQDVNNAGITVQKATTAPLLLVALNSPNRTYNNI